MSFQVRGPGWFDVALATVAAVFLLAFPVATQSPGNGRGRIVRINGVEAIEGEVLLKYRDDRVRANHAALEAAADADISEALDRRGARRMRSRRLRTVELLALLAQDPDVEYVEPNYVTRLVSVPDDPSFTSLWGLFNNALNPVGGGGVSGADIDAPGAWDLTTGTAAHVVAILDTGVDYNHPDLAANMWSAPSSYQVTIGGVTVTCAAGTHGFNTITRTCNPMDDHFHGTHVAGTIGARGNNSVGIAGVNWTTSMMAVKVMGSSGTGTLADAVAGMDYVLQVKAAFASTAGADVRVLNNSWEVGGNNTSMMNAVIATNAADMLFVAAAGNSASNNDSTPNFPASYGEYHSTPNVIAVAASTSSDQLAPYSNYGPTTVQLAAPGSAILSTVPGNGYAVAQGTSMAAPHVSGAAMLVLSACDLHAEQLKSLLVENVDLLPAFASTTRSGGRLNVRAAVQSCPAWSVTGLTLTPSSPAPGALGTTVTWTAVAQGGLAPHDYRFYVWDGVSWTLARDWSTDNTFAWTPTSANDAYKVAVNVRSAGNTASEKGVSQAFAIKTGASSVTLTSDLTAPRAPGTPVTWTASAAGGQAPYSYRFIVWDGAVWSEGRAWGASNVFTWTPGVADPDYKVAVLVRSAWNTGPSEISIAKPFAIRLFATSVTLTSDIPAPQVVGSDPSFMASASGGEAPYEYQYSVWDGVSWTVVRNWSTGANFIWRPAVPDADYRIVVKARSVWNTGDSEVYTSRSFPIFTPISSVSATPNLASPRLSGTAVTFTAAASGGQGSYQFQWLLQSPGSPSYSVAQAWSTSSTFTWTPTVTGMFTLRVLVRNALSSGAFERAVDQTYSIRAPLSITTLTPNLASPRPGGTTINWSAVATGGSTPRYQWFLFDGTTWINLTGWVATSTYAWTPVAPNANYRFGVRVRSDWSTGAAEDTEILPFVIQ
jgi:subtilisin family serine protease